MGYKFSLVLSREITDEESAILKGEGWADAVFSTDPLPTNADLTVTKMDFDTTAFPTLAEAIDSALEAVKKVQHLTAPGLTVPAQPAGPITEKPDESAESTAPEKTSSEDSAIEGVVVEERPRSKSTRKPNAKKPTAQTEIDVSAEAPDDAKDLA